MRASASMNRSLPLAMLPAYPDMGLGTDIPLYDGPLELRSNIGNRIGSGRVWLALQRACQVRFKLQYETIIGISFEQPGLAVPGMDTAATVIVTKHVVKAGQSVAEGLVQDPGI